MSHKVLSGVHGVSRGVSTFLDVASRFWSCFMFLSRLEVQVI